MARLAGEIAKILGTTPAKPSTFESKDFQKQRVQTPAVKESNQIRSRCKSSIGICVSLPKSGPCASAESGSSEYVAAKEKNTSERAKCVAAKGQKLPLECVAAKGQKLPPEPAECVAAKGHKLPPEPTECVASKVPPEPAECVAAKGQKFQAEHRESVAPKGQKDQPQHRESVAPKGQKAQPQHRENVALNGQKFQSEHRESVLLKGQTLLSERKECIAAKGQNLPSERPEFAELRSKCKHDIPMVAQRCENVKALKKDANKNFQSERRKHLAAKNANIPSGQSKFIPLVDDKTARCGTVKLLSDEDKNIRFANKENIPFERLENTELRSKLMQDDVAVVEDTTGNPMQCENVKELRDDDRENAMGNGNTEDKNIRSDNNANIPSERLLQDLPLIDDTIEQCENVKEMRDDKDEENPMGNGSTDDENILSELPQYADLTLTQDLPLAEVTIESPQRFEDMKELRDDDEEIARTPKAPRVRRWRRDSARHSALISPQCEKMTIVDPEEEGREDVVEKKPRVRRWRKDAAAAAAAAAAAVQPKQCDFDDDVKRFAKPVILDDGEEYSPEDAFEEDSSSVDRVVLLFGSLLQKFKQKLQNKVKGKTLQILEYASENIKSEVASVQLQVESEVKDSIQQCKRKSDEIERELHEGNKKFKLTCERFQRECNEHLENLDQIKCRTEGLELDFRASAEKNRIAHRKLIVKAQKCSEEHLSAAVSKINAVKKAERQMKGLRDVLQQLLLNNET